MLKLKHSHVKDEWIVYNSDNFNLHTHTRHKRVAVALKRTVEHREIPKSEDMQFIVSCIRLTNNRRYKRELEEYLESIKTRKKSFATDENLL